MCGLLFSTDPCVDRARFLRALRLLEHRGPDSPGGYTECRGAKLGHNRLKVLDLDDRSNQPFLSRNGRYLLIYNGEIYNFRELAARFGIEMRTSGDTEVLVELYARLGPRCLDFLNGMFALVILDRESGEFFAARDRLGIKPLYYTADDSGITIASEIAALLELVGNRPFDPFSLRQYRKMRGFFGGRTPYKGVRMLPAGHYMVTGRVSRYWQLPESAQADPADEELERLLEEAVRYRCIADVRVGSYLSGGLDSTIIAALASKPDTWTVGFPEANEFEWGRLAARELGSVHTEVIVTREEFLPTVSAMVRRRLEPLSVPNEVLLFRMTSEVKKKNTVVLSGEGADELFFGYDRIFRWAATSEWDSRRFAQLYSYGTHEDLAVLDDAMAPFSDRATTLDRVAAFFQIEHLHGLLRRLDNSTMLSAVEARVPFVDHRLVERMAGVAFNYRMAGGEVKAPLKRIFRRLVPPTILTREKMGFPVPLDSVGLENLADGDTPMDRWLEFNLGILTNGSWDLRDAVASA